MDPSSTDIAQVAPQPSVRISDWGKDFLAENINDNLSLFFSLIEKQTDPDDKLKAKQLVHTYLSRMLDPKVNRLDFLKYLYKLGNLEEQVGTDLRKPLLTMFEMARGQYEIYHEGPKELESIPTSMFNLVMGGDTEQKRKAISAFLSQVIKGFIDGKLKLKPLEKKTWPKIRARHEKTLSEDKGWYESIDDKKSREHAQQQQRENFKLQLIASGITQEIINSLGGITFFEEFKKAVGEGVFVSLQYAPDFDFKQLFLNFQHTTGKQQEILLKVLTKFKEQGNFETTLSFLDKLATKPVPTPPSFVPMFASFGPAANLSPEMEQEWGTLDSDDESGQEEGTELQDMGSSGDETPDTKPTTPVQQASSTGTVVTGQPEPWEAFDPLNPDPFAGFEGASAPSQALVPFGHPVITPDQQTNPMGLPPADPKVRAMLDMFLKPEALFLVEIGFYKVQYVFISLPAKVGSQNEARAKLFRERTEAFVNPHFMKLFQDFLITKADPEASLTSVFGKVKALYNRGIKDIKDRTRFDLLTSPFTYWLLNVNPSLTLLSIIAMCDEEPELFDEKVGWILDVYPGLTPKMLTDIHDNDPVQFNALVNPRSCRFSEHVAKSYKNWKELYLDPPVFRACLDYTTFISLLESSVSYEGFITICSKFYPFTAARIYPETDVYIDDTGPRLPDKEYTMKSWRDHLAAELAKLDIGASSSKLVG